MWFCSEGSCPAWVMALNPPRPPRSSKIILLDIVPLFYNVHSTTLGCQCCAWKECWKWEWHSEEGENGSWSKMWNEIFVLPHIENFMFHGCNIFVSLLFGEHMHGIASISSCSVFNCVWWLDWHSLLYPGDQNCSYTSIKLVGWAGQWYVWLAQGGHSLPCPDPQGPGRTDRT